MNPETRTILAHAVWATAAILVVIWIGVRWLEGDESTCSPSDASTRRAHDHLRQIR